jgi:hypothetical protein
MDGDQSINAIDKGRPSDYKEFKNNSQTQRLMV